MAQKQWWQEEGGRSEQAVANHAVERLAALREPVAAAAPLRDIGEELEEEARVRAAEAKRREAESLAVCYDPVGSAKILRRLKRTAYLVTGMFMSLLLLMVVTTVFFHSHGVGGFGGMLGSMVGPISRYTVAQRRFKSLSAPAVLLTPEGISVDIIGMTRPLIPWNRIVNIEAKRAWGSQSVCLTLKRPPAKPGRKEKLEHVYLPEDVLPISAAAMVARIAAYESTRLKD